MKNAWSYAPAAPGADPCCNIQERLRSTYDHQRRVPLRLKPCQDILRPQPTTAAVLADLLTWIDRQDLQSQTEQSLGSSAPQTTAAEVILLLQQAPANWWLTEMERRRRPEQQTLDRDDTDRESRKSDTSIPDIESDIEIHIEADVDAGDPKSSDVGKTSGDSQGLANLLLHSDRERRTDLGVSASTEALAAAGTNTRHEELREDGAPPGLEGDPQQCAVCRLQPCVCHTRSQKEIRTGNCDGCDEAGCWHGHPNCTFFGRERLPVPDAQLGDNVPHMRQMNVRRDGRTIWVEGERFETRGASGVGCNCLIDTLRQKLNLVCNPAWVRERLQIMFHESGPSKVESENYLELDLHWDAVVRLLGQGAGQV